MRQRNFEAIGETLFEETLPNGLRLCVVPKPGFRGHFAVLAVDYGGAYRRFTLDGAAQMSRARRTISSTRFSICPRGTGRSSA